MPASRPSISTSRESGELPVSWPLSLSRPAFSAAQKAAFLARSAPKPRPFMMLSSARRSSSISWARFASASP